ncbi:MAG: tetratricopeptide repeat protein [bacterium]|nr:tetratricopeptide repeat protein [bacterium]
MGNSKNITLNSYEKKALLRDAILARKVEILEIEGRSDDSEKCLREMLSCAKIHKQKDFLIRTLIYSSLFYFRKDDYKLNYSFAMKAFKLSQVNKNKYFEAMSLMLIGDSYYLSSSFNKAIFWYNKAEKILTHSKWDKLKFELLLSYTNIYNRTGQMKKSIEGYLKCIDISKRLGKKTTMIVSYNNLAMQYMSMQEYSKALKYLNKSFEIAEKIKYTSVMCTILNNLGLIYFNLGDYNSAKRFLKDSITVAKNVQSILDMILSLGNLAITYSAIGEYQKAFDNILKATGILRDTVKNPYYLCYGNAYYSLILNQSGRIKESIITADEVINSSENLQNYSALVLSCIVNANNYFELNNFDKAHEYSQKGIQYLSYCQEISSEDLYLIHSKILNALNKQKESKEFLLLARKIVTKKQSGIKNNKKLLNYFLQKQVNRDIFTKK